MFWLVVGFSGVELSSLNNVLWFGGEWYWCVSVSVCRGVGGVMWL